MWLLLLLACHERSGPRDVCTDHDAGPGDLAAVGGSMLDPCLHDVLKDRWRPLEAKALQHVAEQPDLIEDPEICADLDGVWRYGSSDERGYVESAVHAYRDLHPWARAHPLDCLETAHPVFRTPEGAPNPFATPVPATLDGEPAVVLVTRDAPPLQSHFQFAGFTDFPVVVRGRALAIDLAHGECFFEGFPSECHLVAQEAPWLTIVAEGYATNLPDRPAVRHHRVLRVAPFVALSAQDQAWYTERGLVPDEDPTSCLVADSGVVYCPPRGR